MCAAAVEANNAAASAANTGIQVLCARSGWRHSFQESPALPVMKFTLLTTVLLTGFTTARAELREFKNTKGVVLKAEPVVVRGANLILKLENGQQSTVALKSLSREDQDFVLRWMVHEPKALSYRFDCRSEDKTGATDKKSSRLGKLEATEKSYDIKISNRCQNPIDGLKVAYRVFLADRVQDTGAEREKVGVIWKGGLLDVGRITYNQSTSITTASHSVQKVTPNSLAGFAGVDVKTKKDQMRGVWIKFFRHGVEVAEWKSPAVPKCEWPESAGEKTALETDAATNTKLAAEAAAGKQAAAVKPAAETKPVTPAKVSSDELPQELKIFEMSEVEEK